MIPFAGVTIARKSPGKSRNSDANDGIVSWSGTDAAAAGTIGSEAAGAGKVWAKSGADPRGAMAIRRTAGSSFIKPLCRPVDERQGAQGALAEKICIIIDTRDACGRRVSRRADRPSGAWP